MYNISSKDQVRNILVRRDSQLWYSLRETREREKELGGLYWEAIVASVLRIASLGQMGGGGGDKRSFTQKRHHDKKLNAKRKLIK